MRNAFCENPVPEVFFTLFGRPQKVLEGQPLQQHQHQQRSLVITNARIVRSKYPICQFAGSIICSTLSCLRCSMNAFCNANVDFYLPMKRLLLRNHSKFGFSSGSDIAFLYITGWLMVRHCRPVAERFCHCPGILWRRQHWPNTVLPNTRNRCWREIVFSVHHLTNWIFMDRYHKSPLLSFHVFLGKGLVTKWSMTVFLIKVVVWKACELFETSEEENCWRCSTK
jgi:hypothetical protein